MRWLLLSPENSACWATGPRSDERQGAIWDRLERVASPAGRRMRSLVDDGRHERAVDRALGGLHHKAVTHEAQLRNVVSNGLPGWVPRVVEKSIVDNALSTVQEMADDRDHDVRRRATAGLRSMADSLVDPTDLRDRGERLVQEMRSHPEVREWVSSITDDAIGGKRSTGCDSGSALQQRLVRGIIALGQRLQRNHGSHDHEYRAASAVGSEPVR